MWFVYILLCQDGSLYTGITNNLEKRFDDHKNGKGGRYTRSHQPLRIVYQEKLINHSESLKREAEIKSWSRVKKLELCQ
ncbi:GIY-YIG nuclease family protein [Candidatus Daviesbacteria bacterium]|nr:GIY-YIG nuclease family protein [Candidatus Daviesbacteria bacterium]